MKALASTLKDIIKLTTTIEFDYPELYRFLDENPQTMPKHSTIEQDDFQEYLKGLEEILNRYIQSKGATGGLKLRN